MYPFHSESEKNYKALVGLYIGEFSGVEYGLYELIKAVGDVIDDHNILPNKGVQLTKKISILRKAFKNNHMLSHEVNEMEAILKYIENESKFRHDLVHGVNAQRFKPEPWYTMMWRPEYAKEFPKKESDVRIITEEVLLEKYDGINNAAGAILGLWARLTDA